MTEEEKNRTEHHKTEGKMKEKEKEKRYHNE